MRIVICLCACMVLIGCASALQNKNGMPLARMTFDHLIAYPLDVASYDVIALGAPLVVPTGFIVNPADLSFEYLSKRFKADGFQGKLVAEIQSVAVVHDVVNSSNSFGSMLGVDKQDHYTVDIVVSLSAIGLPTYDSKTTTLKARREIYISEHTSLVEREEHQMRAVDALINDLDQSIQSVLATEFGVFRR